MTETQLNAIKGALLALLTVLATLGVLSLPVADSFAAVVPAVASVVGAFLIKRPVDSDG